MDYMKEALAEAYAGIRVGDGGPFGAVIVRNGEIIGRGHNRVLADHDPTMHGEVAAIRDACRHVGSHDLQGCVLYTTAYPCPMCMAVAMWANLTEIVYGCTAEDTAEIGFRDAAFYAALQTGESPISLTESHRADCQALFAEYRALHAERY